MLHHILLFDDCVLIIFLSFTKKLNDKYSYGLRFVHGLLISKWFDYDVLFYFASFSGVFRLRGTFLLSNDHHWCRCDRIS